MHPRTVATAMAAALAAASTALAVPIEFEFTGTVTATRRTEGTNPPVIGGTVNGLNLGDMVSYTWLVDFDAIGQVIINGSVDPIRSQGFYATHLTGPIFPPASSLGGDYLEAFLGLVEPGFQALVDTREAHAGPLDDPQADDNLEFDEILIFGEYPEELPSAFWVVGREYQGGIFHESNRDGSRVIFETYDVSLTLARIGPSVVDQVPEPGPIVLITVGLLGLAARVNYRRRGF